MKTMVVFSGGLDSTTLLYHLRKHGHTLMAVTVNYAQRHAVEIKKAAAVCARLAIPQFVIDLQAFGKLLPGSQTDLAVAVPYGHYKEDSMRQTVVPNRNMVLLALAGSVAIAEQCECLAYGAHSGDHAIYPDCRPEFIQIMQAAFLECDWSKLQLVVPFQHWTKGEIVREGLTLGVPYELTWTCYEGKEVPCGQCGACTERIEAFKEAGSQDPLGDHAR